MEGLYTPPVTTVTVGAVIGAAKTSANGTSTARVLPFPSPAPAFSPHLDPLVAFEEAEPLVAGERR